MSIYKKLNRSDISIIENTAYKTQTLSSGSNGLTTVKSVSGSKNLNLSSSYWDSLHVQFYLSGSQDVVSSYPGDFSRFRSPFYSLAPYNPKYPIHSNKFFKSASIISIPQQYIGDTIRKGSFTLSDTAHGRTINIKDDKRGNLYATNANISHSTNSPSSSDNYVGNIFYDYGLVTLTETGSFHHTPSSASFKIESSISESNHFFITGSDLSESIKFVVQSGSVFPTETSTVKYFSSGSSTSNTAQNATDKINSVFSNGFITASTFSSIITMSSNDRRPNNPIEFGSSLTDRVDNYPPITGSVGITNFSGFDGGSRYVSYMDIATGSLHTIQFDSTHTIFTREYTITIEPEEFNRTMNVTARGFVSGSKKAESSKLAQSPYMSAHLTASDWNPYITKIHLYGQNKYKDGTRKTSNIQSKTGREISEPLIVANLPRPVKVPKNISLTFKIRLDM